MELAKVKVRLEIEVDVEPSWNRNVTIGQAADHAIDVAQKLVGGLIRDGGKLGMMRFVGHPEATAFMLPPEKKVGR